MLIRMMPKFITEQLSAINASSDAFSSPCGKTVHSKDKEEMFGNVDFSTKESSNIESEPITTVVFEQGDLSDREETQDEEEDGNEETVKKRKKYQAMDDTYRLNRTMRDKDFKLARSHFYCFKDTLGKLLTLSCVLGGGNSLKLYYLHNFVFIFLC